MSLFDFLGGIVGAGASMISSRQQYHYQRALQEQAAQLNYDYGQKSLQNSPTSTRQGLESAGYNPMLAVQNATSGANSGWTSTGQANGTDYASGISQLVSNAQNMQRVKNETEQTESVNDLNYAQADKAKAEKASIMERLPFISQREKVEIGNIEKDSMKKEAEIHNIEETTRYIEKNYELQKRLGEMGINAQILNANSNIYNAKTNRMHYNIDKEVQDIIRDREKRYKEFGKKHPYLRNIDESITRYFNGFSATIGRKK